MGSHIIISLPDILIITQSISMFNYVKGGLDMDSMGARIRSIRKNSGMTQMDFCKKICISQPHLSGIETGVQAPSNTVIRLISILFNVSEDWLISGEK